MAFALAALVLSLGLSPASSAADRNHQLIILAYHEVAEPGEALNPDYAIRPVDLEQQISWLESHGHHFVNVDQVLAAERKGLPARPVLLTFDDGYRSVYTKAFPILKRHHVPAVVAVVGHWLEPLQGRVQLGDQWIDRQQLLSWDELRAMQDSGLVEVASHTYDLHQGISGNPQANSMPAVTTRRYLDNGIYETETSYQQRLREDFRANADLLHRQLGRRPRLIAWPYGNYNAIASAVARDAGIRVGLSLDDGANSPAVPLSRLRRVLVESETTSTAGLARELELRRSDRNDTSRAAKVMHVDLDNIDDPDPDQVERNLKLLLDRIRAMGVNTVYLQAFADADGNGAANAVYFPNRHLPVKRDLFSHVAWEIRTRTPARRVYAWMPVLAFELPASSPGANQKVITEASNSNHLSMGYPRLSPFSSSAMQTVQEIYEDLARSSSFEGLLFHDDVTLSDYEDGSPEALAQYRAWGLPGDLKAIRSKPELFDRWTDHKSSLLEELTLQLAAVVRREHPQLRTARNLYAQVVLHPGAETWYAQSLDAAIRDYDFTAVMAMPYMEKANDPKLFLRELVDQVSRRPHGLERVLFEIQSTDWVSHRDLDSNQMADQLRLLYRLGAHHVGYYPDNLHRGSPDPEVLRPVFTAHSSAPSL